MKSATRGNPSDSAAATKAHRVLADHGRAMTFLVADASRRTTTLNAYVSIAPDGTRVAFIRRVVEPLNTTFTQGISFSIETSTPPTSCRR